MRRNDTLFLAQKLDRQLNMRGSDFVFSQAGEDKYHRATGSVEVPIKGIYHETVTYQSKNTATGSTTHTKSSPMILCRWSEGSQLKAGATLEWSTGKYRVTGVEDIQQLGVACQVSLEVIASD